MVKTAKKLEGGAGRSDTISELEKRFNMIVNGGASLGECAALAETLARKYAKEAEKAACSNETAEARNLINKSVDYWILASQFSLSYDKKISNEVITNGTGYIIYLSNQGYRIDCSEDRQYVLDAISLLYFAQNDFANMSTYLSKASSKYMAASAYLEKTDPKKAEEYLRYADELSLVVKGRKFRLPWDKVTIDKNPLRQLSRMEHDVS